VNLEFLDCSRNQLTGLDLSKNAKLEVVNVYEDQINYADCAKFDIFSHLANLETLDLGPDTDRQLQKSEEINSLIRNEARVKNGGGRVHQEVCEYR